MNAAGPKHPDAHQLAAFGRGLLPPKAASAVETHLSRCNTCQRVVEAVPDDAFVSMVRDAAMAAPTVMPLAGSASGSTPTSTAGSAESGSRTESEVPAALTDHPRYRVIRKLGE